MELPVNWAQWSCDAVAAVTAMNEAWIERHGLRNAPYVWDLAQGLLTFRSSGRVVTANICVVGTASDSDQTFLWAWANDSLPRASVRGAHAVREFGAEHDLGLLVTPEIPGGVAQGKECAAIAARVLAGC